MSAKSSAQNDAHYTADPRVHIGHVHLKVADLERALSFYSGVLGLDVTQRLGDSAAFLSAGGYHHHIALNTGKVWEARRRRPARPGFITRRSCTRPASRWRTPCGGSCTRTFPSKEQPTTE